MLEGLLAALIYTNAEPRSPMGHDAAASVYVAIHDEHGEGVTGAQVSCWSRIDDNRRTVNGYEDFFLVQYKVRRGAPPAMINCRASKHHYYPSQTCSVRASEEPKNCYLELAPVGFPGPRY